MDERGHAVLGPGGFVEPIEGRSWKVRTAEILDGVTAIPDSAFKDCTWLTSIAIPPDTTSIGSFAFHRGRRTSTGWS